MNTLLLLLPASLNDGCVYRALTKIPYYVNVTIHILKEGSSLLSHARILLASGHPPRSESLARAASLPLTP